MFTIYVYVLDTLADWEIGHVTAELHSGRFFKKDAPKITLKTVSYSKDPIHTMGGLKIIPDCLVEDIEMNENSVLLLPGADTWNDPKHYPIIEKAKELISINATVAAICGATVALANYGLLDNCTHTSNGVGFLDMFAPNYKGKDFYVDQPAIASGNVITGACTGSLLWAKLILKHLNVFEANTLEYWHKYFTDGSVESFYALMQTLPHSI